MMNFSYGLPAVLIGAAVVVVQSQLAMALTPTEVNAIAKKITVRIDGEAVGSGVIFERKGDTYYVLTNRHVMISIDREGRKYDISEVLIQTPDSQRYKVYYCQEIPGLDLAVLQFKSKENYNTANLGNSEQITEGMTVYVAGWSDSLPGITKERTYQFTPPGFIRGLTKNPEQGYGLLFDSQTVPGMSGGPVLDENARVVGIHAAAADSSEVRKEGTLLTVYRLGIPINTFLAARNKLQPLIASSPTTTPEATRATTATAGKPNTTQATTVARQPSAETLISLGGSKANKGDYQGAIADYNQALRINPNNPDAYFQLGSAHFQIKEYQAAIANFNKVLQLTPSNAFAYLLRGAARGSQADYKGAIEDFNQGIRINPKVHLAYYARGSARNLEGDTKGAIIDYTEAIRLNPSYVDAYKERGNVHYKQKDYPAAIADYNQALSFLDYSGIGVRYGSNEQTKGLLIITEVIENTPASKGGVNAGDQVLAINGKSTVNKNEEELSQLINNQVRGEAGTQVTLRIRRKGRNDFDLKLTRAQITNPQSAELYNNRGLAYANQRDSQRAIADYERAMQRDPKYAHAYYNRGLIYHTSGDNKRALEDFQKASNLYQQQGNRDNYQSAQDRIRELQSSGVAFNQRDYKAELAAATQAIEQNSNNAEAYVDRAAAYYNQEDKRRSLEDLNQATRINPKYSLAWYNRGWILGELGRTQDAIGSFDRAIQVNSEWGESIGLADAYDVRCATHSAIGNYQKAIADCNQALQLKPNFANAYINRGDALAQQGDDQQASKDYDQAVRLAPNLVYAYFSRGSFRLTNQDDYQGAIADFTKATQLDPKYAIAYALRGLTHQRQGDNQKAIADFNQAVKLDPENPIAYFARGLNYHLQGDYSGALAAYEKATARNERLLPAVNNIGLVKYELGDLESAIRQWTASIAIARRSPEPQLALAVAVYTKGEQERGLVIAEGALRLDKRFANLEFLKKNLWGDRLVTDTQKLLETPRIQAILSKLQ